MSQPTQVPIAIIGASAIFPGSVDKTGFWNDILAGNDLVTDIPPTHWLIEDYYDPDPSVPDMTYAKRGAFLGDIDFDALDWGVPPSILPATDTVQLLALIAAKRVLEDAARVNAVDRERTSVILGVTSGQDLLGKMVSRLQHPVWKKSLREMGLPESEVQEACKRISSHYAKWEESTFPGLLGNVVAGRIANRLDLGGTNCVTDAACASSFSAIQMAVNELTLHQSDLVISGGCDTMNDIFMFMCFSKTPALSASGECAPFSDKADGTLLGEGLGMVALKRLEDAQRDGDRVYAVLKGVGSSSDGRSKSVYAPVPKGQSKAITRAYELAGYGTDTVELVEAHGTGTKAGDAAEFGGLQLAFDQREDRQYCALGTVKSQIGHTKAAAGAAGLFKAVMALHHKVLPPTIKIDQPNPKLDIENTPFYLNTIARPWIRSSDHPRRAGVSSFGFGGSNFHLAVEEYTGPNVPDLLRTLPSELVVLTGATPEEVAGKAEDLASRCIPGMLAFVSATSCRSYDATAPCRLAIVAPDEDGLAKRLKTAADHIRKNGAAALSTPNGVFWSVGAEAGELALLFPGQGSQYLRMGVGLAFAYQGFRKAFDAAADLELGDLPLHDVVFPKPVFDDASRDAQSDRLTRTEWAQPAIGAHSLGMLNLARELGLNPKAVGGHSFGEIVALHAAGVLSADDALKIARRRGELMAEAASLPGAMLAVPRTVEEVRAVLAEVGGDAVVANHNAPTQVVVSGPTAAVEAVEKALIAKGIEPKRLSVATAFHSSVVAGSTKPFAEFLAGVEFGTAGLDVYANSTAAPYPADVAAMRTVLAEQIASPVRFVEQIEAMYASGVRTFVECGPGNVLGNLVRQILGDRPFTSVSMDRRRKHDVNALQTALAELVVAGVPVQLSALWEGYGEPVDPHTRVKPKLALQIRGNNYGQPYPPPEGASALPGPNPPRPEPEPQIVYVDREVHVPVPAPASDANPQEVVMSNNRPQASSDLWVHAFAEAQRQTAEAHATYQQAMASSHQSYLRTVEASFATLGALATGAPVQVAHYDDTPRSTPAAMFESPAFYAAPPPTPVAPAPTAPTYAPAPSYTPAPVAAAPAPAPVAKAAPAPVAVKAPVAAAPSMDLKALLMDVVADKTGYPAEMLNLEMTLEGDLGIDSIKRVEILSAMREREPALPEVDAGEMAALNTLGEIVSYMDKTGGASVAAAPSAAPAAKAPVAAAPSMDLKALLMDVVADKTGYPAEMLNLGMTLEGDLGIDSIKRVEILSAMREREPALPEVDAGEMAALNTLGEIVSYMDKTGGASVAAAPSAAPAAGSTDLQGLLMDVVADKTGYPAEMLNLEMTLEGDLGIDSIKRVEILSAMREREPSLPEVDAGEMAQLATLGQIVAYMDSTSGAVSVPNQAQPEVSSPELGRFALELVDAPALGLTQPGLHHPVHVTGNDTIGLALVEALKGRGVVASYGTPPEGAKAVIHLGGLGEIANADTGRTLARDAFALAHRLAGSLSTGLFVTVQDTGGDFGLSGSDRCWFGHLPGLTKTAAQEWPEASTKAIDIAVDGRSPEAVAEALADELIAGGPELEVALTFAPAGMHRRTLRSVRRTATAGMLPVGPESVVVVSGGARGVTAATVIALAAKSKSRFVLLGRTGLTDDPPAVVGVSGDAELKRALMMDAKAKGQMIKPADLGKAVSRILANREIRETLAHIEAVGGRARYVSVDVTDGDGMAKAFDSVRKEWGPITGIIHGAGVLADKLIAEKTPDQFDFVFDTKIGGLQALLQATESDPLALVVLFSSVAARCGNQGQCDYAMANELLNKLAPTLRKRGAVVKSLGWGPWEGGMVTPALKARFESLGVPLIPLSVGARMLVDEVADPTDDLELVLGGEPKSESLAAESKGPSVSLAIKVDRTTLPQLADHAIAGNAVVPVVLALEWFARAARACRPGLHLASIEGVRVLRGIKVGDLDTGVWLNVRCREIRNGVGSLLEAEITGVDGAKHYSATLKMTDDQEKARRPSPTLDLGAFTDEVYDGHVLFHGTQFQVIDEVKGVGDQGIEATLSGTTAKAWSGTWRTDPAALDGGLQLALLWSKHVLGGATLPTAVSALHTYADGPAQGPLRCVVRGEKKSKDRAVADLVFSDASGAVYAELFGVETHLRP
ncbi:MAG: SDR family NAD(P)-dependent oxidoreductase [Myxococcota bacterium]